MPIDRASRCELLRLFHLPEREIRPLWRKKFDPSHANVYRGWFPLQKGFLTSKEGIDMGPDVAYGASVVCGDDPLREPRRCLAEQALPGWRETVAALLSRHGRDQPGADALDRARLASRRSISSTRPSIEGSRPCV